MKLKGGLLPFPRTGCVLHANNNTIAVPKTSAENPKLLPNAQTEAGKSSPASSAARKSFQESADQRNASRRSTRRRRSRSASGLRTAIIRPLLTVYQVFAAFYTNCDVGPLSIAERKPRMEHLSKTRRQAEIGDPGQEIRGRHMQLPNRPRLKPSNQCPARQSELKVMVSRIPTARSGPGSRIAAT